MFSGRLRSLRQRISVGSSCVELFFGSLKSLSHWWCSIKGDDWWRLKIAFQTVALIKKVVGPCLESQYPSAMKNVAGTGRCRTSFGRWGRPSEIGRGVSRRDRRAESSSPPAPPPGRPPSQITRTHHRNTSPKQDKDQPRLPKNPIHQIQSPKLFSSTNVHLTISHDTCRHFFFFFGHFFKTESKKRKFKN